MKTQQKLMRMRVHRTYKQIDGSISIRDEYSNWLINAQDLSNAFIYCINDEAKSCKQLEGRDEIVVLLHITDDRPLYLYLPCSNEMLQLSTKAFQEMSNVPESISRYIVP